MELELSADDNPTKSFSLRAARTDLGNLRHLERHP
jgi:hypothetical protein